MSNETATRHFAADAEVLIGYKERQRRHGVSERSPDVDGVMATIAPPEKLTWTRTLCWAFNQMPPTDDPKVSIYTTPAQIRSFYDDFLSQEVIIGTMPPMTDIRGNWYTFSETRATPMRNTVSGLVRDLDSATVSLYDGGEGISGEVCWRRCADVQLTNAERAERWAAYLAALRAQDVAALVALMSSNVQGAVRDYFDAEPPFVAIDGTDAMRAYYEKFFEHVDVVDVTPVRIAIREWFVFSELRWTVTARTGAAAGQELRFLTAEHMPFDAAGFFQARFGYGTEME